MAKQTSVDGKRIPIAPEGPVSPNTIIKVAGHGLPMTLSDGRVRGDLFVKFDIRFPEFISQEHKDRLQSVLGETKL